MNTKTATLSLMIMSLNSTPDFGFGQGRNIST